MAFPRARDGHVDFGLRGRFGVCGIWDSLGFAVTGTGLAIAEPKPRRKRAPKLLEAPGAKPLAHRLTLLMVTRWRPAGICGLSLVLRGADGFAG